MTLREPSAEYQETAAIFDCVAGFFQFPGEAGQKKVVGANIVGSGPIIDDNVHSNVNLRNVVGLKLYQPLFFLIEICAGPDVRFVNFCR